MGQKDLERLVGKLRSMHLAVPGAVSYLYHIQRVLSQAGTDRAWLSPAFYRDIADWKFSGIRQPPGPLISPRSSVENPPIWGYATPQDSGPGECG